MDRDVNQVVITGASDDIVVVDGAIQDEFYVYSEDGRQGRLLFDTGTCVAARLTQDGWRLTVDLGGGDCAHIECLPVDGLGPPYTDRVTVNGQFTAISCDDGGRGDRTVHVAGHRAAGGEVR